MLYNFLFKLKGAPVALLFIVLLNSFASFAQQGKDDIYVDYQELTNNILKNYKAAQSKTPFMSSAELRKNTLLLVPGTKAKVTGLPQAGKKDLSAVQLVKDRKDGVLMICKLLKPINGNKERIQVLATGTALTEDGICISNWHVFMKQIQPELNINASDSVTFAVTLKGDVYPIEKIMAFSEAGDAAIFKINTGKDRLSAIPLGTALEVGETVHALTHPEFYLYYYSKGVVARNTANHITGPMGNRMEITADYAIGSSGGPILDDRGNMAAMVSTTHSIYVQNNENLQMVIKTTIPVGSIKSLMIQ